MTEIDNAMAPFVEAEIKEHQAAFVLQMVTIGVITCVFLILVASVIGAAGKESNNQW
jgi:hypothetical protein